MVVGREQEQAAFKKWLQSTQAEFAVIYGRRRIDLIIDRNDGIINLCEAKFTNKAFALTKDYTADLRRKRTVFQEISKTKKMVTTVLLTTYPALQNAY